MPELPDLEVMAGFLQARLAGARVEKALVLRPIVVRNLVGDELSAQHRRLQRGAGSPASAGDASQALWSAISKTLSHDRMSRPFASLKRGPERGERPARV